MARFDRAGVGHENVRALRRLQRLFKTDSRRPCSSGCTAAATDTGPSEVAAPAGRCTSVSSHPIDAVSVLAANDRSGLDRPALRDPLRSLAPPVRDETVVGAQ